MAINYGYPTGRLRLLVADVDETNLLLTDEQVEAFLAMHGVAENDQTPPLPGIQRAAADALDTIASSEALVSKKIRTARGDTTDGPAVAAALRAHAAQLRTLADQADAAQVDADDEPLTVVEFSPYPSVRWPL